MRDVDVDVSSVFFVFLLFQNGVFSGVQSLGKTKVFYSKPRKNQGSIGVLKCFASFIECFLKEVLLGIPEWFGSCFLLVYYYCFRY